MFEFILNGMFKDFSLIKEGIVSIYNSPNEIRMIAQEWISRYYIEYEVNNYLEEKGFENYIHMIYLINTDSHTIYKSGEVIAEIRLSHEGISKCQELETLFKMEGLCYV